MPNPFRASRALAIVVLSLAALGLPACEDGEPTLPPDAPAGHTVNNDGVAHMPGLFDPMVNCTACHGADLMGGTAGQPSCFSCHGQLW